MTLPLLSPWPTPPDMTQDQATFDANAEATVGHFPVHQQEMNEAIVFVNDCTSQVSADRQQTALDVLSAASYASAAATAADAPKWVSGTGYPQGQCVWSPLNFQTYRAKRTTQAGSAHAYWRIRVDLSNSSAVALGELAFKDAAGTNLFASVGGTAIEGQSHYSTNTPANLFDGDIYSYWQSLTVPSWVGAHFNSPVSVGQVTLTGSIYTDNGPRNFYLEYSDDGVTWSTLLYVSGQTSWSGSEVRTFYAVYAPGTVDPSQDTANWSLANGRISWSRQTASFNAASFNGYKVNTSAGSVTMTLPAAPADGDEIPFKDSAGTFGAIGKTLIIDGNGKTVNGGTRLIIDLNYFSGTLVYDGTDGWGL